jgi:hypothetical protein
MLLLLLQLTLLLLQLALLVLQLAAKYRPTISIPLKMIMTD